MKKVRELYDEKTPLVFLIDNASWHKKGEVQEFSQQNNITLLFLPPYSPELNPIERVWGFLKDKISQLFFKTAREFKDFIFSLLDNINTTDSDKLMSQCINKVNFEV